MKKTLFFILGIFVVLLLSTWDIPRIWRHVVGLLLFAFGGFAYVLHENISKK